MKAWVSIYLLFARIIGRVALLFVIGSSILIILLQKFFSGGHDVNSAAIITMPLIFTGTLFFLALFMLVSRNYNWLMIVPLAKRQIIVLQGLINISLIITAVISYSIIIAIVDLSLTGGFSHFHYLVDAFTKVEYEVLRLGSDIAHRIPLTPEVYAPIFFVSMLSILLLFGSSPTRFRQRISFRRVPQSAWFRSHKIMVTSLILCIPLGFLLARDLQSFFFSPFGLFIWLTLMVALLIPKTWVRELALGGRSARISFVSLLVVAILQISLVYTVAILRMGGKPEHKTETLTFLGPFAGPLNRSEFVNLLQSDLSFGSVKSLGKSYCDKHNNGSLLDRNKEKYIDFTKLITSKTTKEGVYGAYQLYDPLAYGLSDLQTIYHVLSKNRDDGSDLKIFLRFVNARLSLENMRELFNSTNKLENIYALLRARYDQNPAYLTYIITNLSRYPEKVVLLALDSLSILRGDKVTLEDWHALRNGRNLATTEQNLECEHFSTYSIETLKPSDAGRLNTCLRQMANKSNPFFLARLEQEGWVEIPLNPQARWLATKILSRAR